MEQTGRTSTKPGVVRIQEARALLVRVKGTNEISTGRGS